MNHHQMRAAKLKPHFTIGASITMNGKRMVITAIRADSIDVAELQGNRRQRRAGLAKLVHAGTLTYNQTSPIAAESPNRPPRLPA